MHIPTSLDLHCMRRVAVVGNAGGGKTTLSRALGRRLDLPVFAFDSIKWYPGWVPAPAAEIERRSRAWLAGERWIIDGLGSWDFTAEELARADTILLPDLPLTTHYRWALKRHFHDIFHPRPDLPEHCPMLRITLPLLKTIWSTHRLARPRLLHLAGAAASRGCQLLHLRSAAEIRGLLLHLTAGDAQRTAGRAPALGRSRGTGTGRRAGAVGTE